MKTAEKKEQFIILRAEGLSYGKIAAQLEISKSTCSKWEKDFSGAIQTAKEDRLNDLYTLYRLGKENHIKKLGETLERIDTALAQKDLTEIPADKLLKLKLEYEEKLQEQYTEPIEESFTEYSSEELLEATAALYERVKAGAITVTQAKAELITLKGVKQAVEDTKGLFDFEL